MPLHFNQAPQIDRDGPGFIAAAKPKGSLAISCTPLPTFGLRMIEKNPTTIDGLSYKKRSRSGHSEYGALVEMLVISAR
jgi:hypothetical protein